MRIDILLEIEVRRNKINDHENHNLVVQINNDMAQGATRMAQATPMSWRLEPLDKHFRVVFNVMQ